MPLYTECEVIRKPTKPGVTTAKSPRCLSVCLSFFIQKIYIMLYMIKSTCIALFLLPAIRVLVYYFQRGKRKLPIFAQSSEYYFKVCEQSTISFCQYIFLYLMIAKYMVGSLTHYSSKKGRIFREFWSVHGGLVPSFRTFGNLFVNQTTNSTFLQHMLILI